MGLEDILQPNWSPDGSRIAVSVDKAVGWDVYVMNADGSDLVQLTDDPGVDLDPVWSPGP